VKSHLANSKTEAPNMDIEEHYRPLERMYLAAPINDFFKPTITVADSEATIEIQISEKLYHSANGVHGSVYFKLLDDAAFFAANSNEREMFVLTATFTTNLTRPVSSGIIRAIGRIVDKSGSKFMTESIIYKSDGEEIGNGNGVFVRGKTPLVQARGYKK